MKGSTIARLTLLSWVIFWMFKVYEFDGADWSLAGKVLFMVVTSAVLGALSTGRD